MRAMVKIMISNQSSVPSIDAVLFDFDGVLVDSEPLHFECWREVLEDFGLHFRWDEYIARLGLPDRELIAEICALHALPFDAVWAGYPRKQRAFSHRIADGRRMSADLKQLLSSLRDSLPMAVVTSSSRGEIEPFLTAHSVRDCFKVLVCSEDVCQKKPDPEPYRTAAKQLDCSHPLVVEDSPAGVASARAAGFEVVVIPTPADTVRLTKLALASGGY